MSVLTSAIPTQISYVHFSYVSWVVSIKYGTIFEIRLCGKGHRFCTATRLSQAPWCILTTAAHRRNMRRPAAVTLIAAELGLASEQSLARRLVVILQVPTIWSPSRLYSPYSLPPTSRLYLMREIAIAL